MTVRGKSADKGLRPRFLRPTGYKLLFSHAEMVADLLRGFVPDAWVKELDFSTLEKVGGSYVSDDLREREDDIIWRVRFGQEWLYVYLLLEFQSSVDRYMAVRILTYVGLLYQDLIRTGQLTPRGELPPILPVVLYNGLKRWEAPEDVEDLMVAVPGGLERYRPRLRYLLLDEGRFADTQLAPLKNLAAALFRLENSRTPEELRQVLQALIDWLKAPEQTGLRRAFTVWVKRVLLPGRVLGVNFEGLADLTEVETMLAERVKQWTEEWKQQGLEQGIQQGMQQGMQQGLQQGEAILLLRQLERRFGPLPEAIRQQVRSADTECLLAWGERVLTARTLDEVFGEERQ
jgi:hypothetical protein